MPITYSVRELLIYPNGYVTNGGHWQVVENGSSIKITNTLRDDTPKTGDNSWIMLWSGILLTSAIGCGGAMWIARRKKEEYER